MKKIFSVVLILFLILLLAGCGETTYRLTVDDNFDRAIIKFPDGNIIEVNVKEWTSSIRTEEYAIVDENGITYRVNSVNCILIKGGETE